MSTESASSQIFQSFSPRRWQRFLWGARVAIAVLLLAWAGLAWALFQQSATLLPRAFGPNETFKQILNPTHFTTLANRHNRAFQAVRRQLPVHKGGYRDPRSKARASKSVGQ